MSVFDGCTGLKTLHLNEGLQEIHGHALCGANSLEGTLNIPSTLPALGLFNVTTKIKHLVIGKAVENNDYSFISLISSFISISIAGEDEIFFSMTSTEDIMVE